MKSTLKALLVFASIQTLFAQEMNCDFLAASPLDPQKTTTGISYEKLNAAQAVPACKQAIEINPRVGRLWFQYGRALEKANRIPDAITAYQEAAKLNSGAANNNIGELYRDGKGFQKDLKKAEEYFTKAAELNSIEGAENLSKLKNSYFATPKEQPEKPIQKKQTANKDSESEYSKRIKEEDRRQCLKFVESRKTCAVAANYGRCMDISFGSNMWYVYKDICSY
jgi:TPR repeat protein